jgi:hypothetical protein
MPMSQASMVGQLCGLSSAKTQIARLRAYQYLAYMALRFAEIKAELDHFLSEKDATKGLGMQNFCVHALKTPTAHREWL